MTAKHTPGPWKIVDHTDHWELISESGDSLMGSMGYYPWVPDKKADWILIAAAPDMLEALKLASGWMVVYVPPEVKDLVHTAIAKATGEQS